MKCRHVLQNLYFCPLPHGDSHAMHLSHAITYQDERFVEAAGVKRAGGVCEVVRHGNELLIPIHPREIVVQVPFLDSRRVQFMVLFSGVIWLLKGCLERFVVESMSQEIHYFPG